MYDKTTTTSGLLDGPAFDARDLVALLRRRGERQAERLAYTFLTDGETAEESLTYGELDERARAVGAMLQGRGLSGERVLLLYPPGLEYVAAFWGCLYAGAVAVPVYPPRQNQSLRRLEAVAADAQAKAALTAAQYLSRRDSADGDSPALSRLSWLTAGGDESAGEWRPPVIGGDTPAFLQYTSGSTAEPKGVMLSHGNLWHNERMIREAFRQTEQSVIVGWLPLYHDMGLIGNVLQAAYVGARCVLMSPVSFLQNPARWLAAITRYKATTSGGPNFAYDLCARKIPAASRESFDLSSWAVAFNGAEPIRHDTLERFAAAFAPCGFRREAFFPCYGLAEATLFVAGDFKDEPPVVRAVEPQALELGRVADAPHDDASAVKLVGSGRAADGQRVIVVNPETLRPCAAEEVGEIWVSGPSVARGYWNRPEESEHTFGAYLADGGEGPYLRTGDLGFLEGGELFVTGRLKDLIIVRGRNYYPQDIERTVEESHGGLRPGCGAAFAVELDGEERLVVVQETERHPKADPAEMIGAIRQAVADAHEVQVYAVALVRPGTVPKTSSGKLRRGDCRAKFLSGQLEAVGEWRAAAARTGDAVSTRDAGGATGEADEATAGGASSVEEVRAWLVSCLAARVGEDPSALDTRRPVTYYGVDSLAAVELTYELETHLGVGLSVTDCLQSRSIDELAARAFAQLSARAQARPEAAARAAESSPRATDAAPSSPQQAADAAAAHPLSHGQRALWFLHQLDPQNPAYNITAAARILSELDAEALRRAWQALVERHPSLRTTFAQSDGEPVQYVRAHAAVCFSHEDAAGWGETVLAERVAAEGSRPFVLEEGPLLRINLFTRSEREHLLLLVVHHAVADFWSLSLLVEELGRLYEAEKAGGEARLAPLALSYTDHARRQAEFLDGEGGARSWAYWERQLDGAPSVLNLPTDRPRPPVQTFRGAAHAFSLDAELTRRLKEFARESGGTLYMTLLAAFQVLLHRYTGQDDLLVGSPASGRDRAELARLVGYFINPVVLRARLGDNPTFGEFAARVRRTVLEAFEHQDYPFALLVERLQPERDPSRSPLFQVMFTLQKTPGDDGAGLAAFALGEAGVRVWVGDLLLESAAQPQQAAQFDLTLMVAEVGGRLSASLQYNEDLFDQAWASRMGEHFRALLEDIVAHPERRVSDLNFLTRAERRQLIRDWNDTRTPYPQDVCVHQTFEARAAGAPDAVAVCFRDEQLTYGELNRRADRLARQLKSRGVGPDVRVGVCLRRSAGMVVALLGVLKAGGAYVPLDPTYPRERLALMLDDARASVLLTERSLAGLLPEHGAQTVYLDAAAHAPSQAAATGLGNPNVGPDNLAYVIYTSGSTGRPKGVMVSHRNVVNFFGGMDERVGGDGPGTWLAVTSISFDISVLELLWTLARGFRVVLQPDQSGAAYGLAGREQVGRGAMDFSLFYFAAADDDAAADKYDLLMKGAAFADRNGFAAVWTPERHFHSFGGLYPNPSVIGAALAAVTERIQIRAGSVVLPLHSPVRVAEEWAVVDNLSRGRVGVSFASGWHADDFVFAPENYERRKELMMLHVETVRRLWRGEAITFKGGASDVEVRIRPRPVQAELPVWITAAGHPDTFRAAGEAGANLLTHLLGQSVEELAEKIKIYRESWRPREHGPERGRVTLMLHTFVGEDLETVRAKVRKPLSSYLATSLDLARNLLRSLGESVDGELGGDDLEALLAHAFDRYYNTSGLFGTPQSCLQMVNRLKSIGVDETACLIDFGIDGDSTLAGLRQLNLLRQLSDAGREADEDDHTPAELLARHNVTHMQCTPSLAGALVEDEAAGSPLGALGKLLVGGEALPESLAARLREKVRGEIHNMYGPTETTIWSATHRLAQGDGAVPIGRPVANTEIYVLDPHLQPVPVGMNGEVFIGGEGVVRGYLRRPGHTSERFIPDPFGDRPGARLYRTGDLARYLPDGSVAYLGRIDSQVKVRGHRIELGEIESALREHACVREAVVVAREYAPGDTRLLAYLVAHSSERALLPRLGADGGAGQPDGGRRHRLPNGMSVVHHGSFQTSVLYKEIFEDEVYFRHGVTVADGDCVFDVGANIGLFSLYVNRRCEGASIYAFEPIRPNFETLRANLSHYGVRAKLFECGLGDRAGEAEFTFYPQAAGLSGRVASVAEDKSATRAIVLDWLGHAAPGAQESILPREQLDEALDEYLRAETYVCPMKTLSEVIREEGVGRIDLLKIDVEGSESDVLRGIDEDDWGKIGQLVMEVHSAELLAEVGAMLKRRGYETAVEENFSAAASDPGAADARVYTLYAVHPSRRAKSAAARDGDAAPPSSPSQAARLEVGEVRAHLREKLPDYMIPSAFTVLDALPLTPNGKVDRRALSALDPQGPAAGVGDDYVAPRTPTEEALAEVWSELLGVERPGVHDNFFDAGGHSLQATRLVAQVRSVFGVELTLRDFLRSSTIAGLADIIEQAILATATSTKLEEVLELLEGLGDTEAERLLEVDAELSDG